MRKWVKIATGAIVVVIVIALSLTLLGTGRKPNPDPVGSAEKLESLLLSLDSIGEDNYKKYLRQYSSQIYVGEDIVLSLESIPEKDRTASAENTVRLPIAVQKAGLYTVGFDYKCLGDNLLQTSLSMKVNEELPYSELQHLFFADTWRTGETEYDRYGNESIAMPEKDACWSFTWLRDISFLQNEPLMIYLDAGDNELELTANEGVVVFRSVTLAEPVVVADDPVADAAGTAVIPVEAEDFVTRTSPNIRTTASFDPDVTPYDAALKLQNIVDEATFRTGGTSVTYDVVINTAGWYHFACDYKQSAKSDFTVYRNIYIDGVIPSAAYENIAFPYSSKFDRKAVDVPVYLPAGTHQITLEVSLEPYGDAIAILNSIVAEINDLALSVNKITGGNTNKYRDFDLEEYGLYITSDLTRWADTVEQVYALVAAGDQYGTQNGEISLLNAAVKSLRELAKEPDKLPQNINRFSYGDSSVRQYLTTVAENLSLGNLGMDKFYLYQEGAKLPEGKNVFEKASLRVEHFLASFLQDDYAPGYETSDTLEVWANWPRQYLEIIQRMADADFTAKTGIKVNLSIVPDQQKLILSNASGKAPDAAIGISSGYVYDLALRNALADMRQFEDFKDVASHFAPGMLIPGICDDGVYALPETFNFYVLFYRTDVFEKLDLKVPDNMDEVRALLPELQRMGLGFNTHVANLPTKTFAATAPFIFQNGGDLFAEDPMVCRLDSPEVIGGLKYLTENFTVYDMDYEILSFFQSFRDGRTPIGVSNYATYNLLTNAAPELTGCWDIALYPGLVSEDGTVERYTSGAAESCIIFDDSAKKDDAWKFLSWWMSDEVQTEFSFTLQATLGNEYMWNSANLNAIAAAPWKNEHKKVILEQIGWTDEMPRVPGSYIIERELGNVLVNVVTQNVNIRTAIDDAQKRINAELQRKLEEFGYIDGAGNTIKELIVPDIDMVKEWLS